VRCASTDVFSTDYTHAALEWRTVKQASTLRDLTLRFAPHPDLKDGARKAIELAYGMKDGVASITTRVCLSYYLERQFGLDADSPQGEGERQQIVLVNRDELEAARKEVEDACGPDQSKTSKEDD
jgi:hypothetical protein